MKSYVPFPANHKQGSFFHERNVDPVFYAGSFFFFFFLKEKKKLKIKLHSLSDSSPMALSKLDPTISIMQNFGPPRARVQLQLLFHHPSPSHTHSLSLLPSMMAFAIFDSASKCRFPLWDLHSQVPWCVTLQGWGIFRFRTGDAASAA